MLGHPNCSTLFTIFPLLAVLEIWISKNSRNSVILAIFGLQLDENCCETLKIPKNHSICPLGPILAFVYSYSYMVIGLSNPGKVT